MLTYVIIITLVAALCFALGAAYSNERNAQRKQLEFEESEDERAFRDYVIEDTAATIEAIRFRRPHLKVLHDPDVDAHFDELCRLGLIEAS